MNLLVLCNIKNNFIVVKKYEPYHSLIQEFRKYEENGRSFQILIFIRKKYVINYLKKRLLWQRRNIPLKN